MIPNIDPETGIHYGIIPKNDLLNCAEEFFNEATDITYEELAEEIRAEINGTLDELFESLERQTIVSEELKQRIKDDAMEQIINEFNDDYNDEVARLIYETDEYIIQGDNDDSDLFVIKSPYYTYAPRCSPCAPNAGYLRDANVNAEFKTYCLGPEWFEDEKAQYPIWKVENDEKLQ